MLNYGQVLAPSVVNIVFAHEFGHNLGSPVSQTNLSSDVIKKLTIGNVNKIPMMQFFAVATRNTLKTVS